MPAFIKCKCPHCAAPLRVGEQFGGKTVPCPKCQGRLVIPRPPESGNASPPPHSNAPPSASVDPTATSVTKPTVTRVKAPKAVAPASDKPRSRIPKRIPPPGSDASIKASSEPRNAFNVGAEKGTLPRRSIERNSGRTPLFIGLGAGAVLLIAVCVSATLWASGVYSKSSTGNTEQLPLAQIESLKSFPSPVDVVRNDQPPKQSSTAEDQIKAQQAAATREKDAERLRAEQETEIHRLAEVAERERERQVELSQPSLERPAFWHTAGSHADGFLGALLAAGTLHDYELDKMQRRTIPKRQLAAEIELWSDTLRQKRVVDDDAIDLKALVTYLGLADGLYENEVFQPARSERYRSRIARLREETIDSWHTGLNRLPEADLERIDTVLYVIQFEALFDVQDSAETNLRKADELLQRLQSIDLESVEEWAELIDSYQVPAALTLIQKDCLFKESIFDKADFRAMAAAARNQFPGKK